MKTPMKKLMFALIIMFSTFAFAAEDELLTVETEGTSKAESAPEASKNILASSTAKVAREQIIDLIGEKAYNKNKNLVENRIVRESFKFIPFVTPGTPERSGAEWKMKVTMRISQQSLREMVNANGLLFDTEGPAAVVPMIAILDRVRGQQYRWWMGDVDEKKTLQGISQSLHQQLFKELNRHGFYVVRPQSNLLASTVPETYRNDRFRPDDMRFWGQFYNAQIILRGDVRVRESTAISGGYQLAVKLSAIQTANNRTVGEVVRNYDTESGNQDVVVRAKLNTAFAEVAKDLGVQVVEAWQRGTLGSNRLRLAVRGKLGPKQLGELKSQLTKTVREIKGVRERLIEVGSVTYEIDYSGGAQALSDRLKSLNVPGYSVKVADVSETQIALEVRAH
jgi:hypothetical protein